MSKSNKWKEYRTFNEFVLEYFTNNPDEIDGYLQVVFEEYAKDPDPGALLSSLRLIARVKGITAMADEVGMTRQGLQKALSSKGNPRLENINAIMRALGYQLMPQKLHAVTEEESEYNIPDEDG